MQSLELGSLAPLRRCVPAGSRIPREGGARDHVGGPRPAPPARSRPARDVPARLGDLREPRARVRRRPRVRDAGRAPRGDGIAPRAASDTPARRGRYRRGTGPRRGRPAPALHVPAARGRGPPVRGCRRAEGGPRRPAVRGDPSGGRRPAGVADGADVRAEDRGRRGNAARPRDRARGGGRGLRPVQPGRVRRQHAPAGPLLDPGDDPGGGCARGCGSPGRRGHGGRGGAARWTGSTGSCSPPGS